MELVSWARGEIRSILELMSYAGRTRISRITGSGAWPRRPIRLSCAPVLCCRSKVGRRYS